jgi:Mce-associated membrane protein
VTVSETTGQEQQRRGQRRRATRAQGPAELTDSAEVPDLTKPDLTNPPDEPPTDDDQAIVPAPRQRRRVLTWIGGVAALVLVAALVAAVVLLAMVKTDGVDAQREGFVQTAKQGVLNLTTIHYATAPQDVQHLLDGASGAFAQDFGGRKDSYIQVVQKAQVNSDGTINSAGLEKVDGNNGIVLVASTAKVSNSSAPGGEARSYRLRVTVTDTNGQMTVSNVEFVP